MTVVTVLTPAAAAVDRALELFDGSLRPSLAASADPGATVCAIRNGGSAGGSSGGTTWTLAGRARPSRLRSGVDTNDPSGFFDRSRVLVAQHAASTPDVAGRIESFGFLLLGTLARRNATRRCTMRSRRRSTNAQTIDDPAALLSGRSKVTDVDGIAIEKLSDPATETSRAIARLLASRSGCVADAQAVGLTADGLRVISAAAEHGG